MSKNSKSKRTEATLSLLITSALVITLAIAIASAVKKGTSNNEYGNIVDLNETEGFGFALDNSNSTTTKDSANQDLINTDQFRSAKGDLKSTDSDSMLDDSDDPSAHFTASNDINSTNNSNADSATNIDGADAASDVNDIAVNAGDSIDMTFSFSESDTLTMPLAGAIVLPYNMDSTIWFPTLQVYKCNPGVYIAGEVGEDVVASAAGCVLSITSNEELGNVVTIDHGNGYATSYGMIDNIRVTPGEMVVAGTAIGSVAAPTSYYSSEGSGTYFSLTHYNTPENPLDYVE